MLSNRGNLRNGISKSPFFALFIGLIWLLSNEIMGWPLLHFWNISGNSRKYIDLGVVLHAADCYGVYGNRVYEIGFFCGDYLYGRTLLILLRLFNVHLLNQIFLGTLLMLVFLSIFFIINRFPIEMKFVDRWTLLGIALAPPFFLMLQRGHVDILMFLLVLLSARALSRGHEVLNLLLISLSSLIKFYTFPLFFLVLFLTKKLTSKLTAVLLMAIVFFIIRTDLRLTPYKANQEPMGSVSGLFGWRVILARLNMTDSIAISESMRIIFSLTLFIIFLLGNVLLLSYWRARKFNQIHLEKKDDMVSFILLGGTFITCYFAGTNFDFRLIFGVAASLKLLSVLDLGSEFRKLTLTSIGLVSWLSFESGGLEIFGDVFVLQMVAIQVVLGACIYLCLLRTLYHDVRV